MTADRRASNSKALTTNSYAATARPAKTAKFCSSRDSYPNGGAIRARRWRNGARSEDGGSVVSIFAGGAIRMESGASIVCCNGWRMRRPLPVSWPMARR